MRTLIATMMVFAVGVSVGCGREPNAAGGRSGDQVLLRPNDAALHATAPDTYRVRFETTAGDFVVEVRRDLAPLGADRFYNLARHRYFDDVCFFRVIDGFMTQFGIHGDPRVNAVWRDQRIPDDPVRESNRRGTLTFAMTSRPNSRTTQVFINTADNPRLDEAGFAPIGRVVEGMSVVDALHSDYGEGAPMGRGPDQERIENEGNPYLTREFPNLDCVRRASIVETLSGR